MSYQSPIELMVNELHTQYEDNIIKAVQEYNITVNKDELLMALRYDRAQYDKGYSDGRFDRDREIVRCGECKWCNPLRAGEKIEEHGVCTSPSAIERIIGMYAMAHGFIVNVNHYCGYGERREDG